MSAIFWTAEDVQSAVRSVSQGILGYLAGALLLPPEDYLLGGFARPQHSTQHRQPKNSKRAEQPKQRENPEKAFRSDEALKRYLFIQCRMLVDYGRPETPTFSPGQQVGPIFPCRSCGRLVYIGLQAIGSLASPFCPSSGSTGSCDRILPTVMLPL